MFNNFSPGSPMWEKNGQKNWRSVESFMMSNFKNITACQMPTFVKLILFCDFVMPRYSYLYHRKIFHLIDKYYSVLPPIGMIHTRVVWNFSLSPFPKLYLIYSTLFCPPNFFLSSKVLESEISKSIQKLQM